MCSFLLGTRLCFNSVYCSSDFIIYTTRECPRRGTYRHHSDRFDYIKSEKVLASLDFPLLPFVSSLCCKKLMDAAEDDLQAELWKACAGESLHIPEAGESVFCEMEQIEALTVEEQNRSIRCRVIRTQLLAEQETDEVYLKISLLPASDETEDPGRNSNPSEPPRPAFHSFCKRLTAIDTSPHGGFSVLRKYATECLPPLDTTQPSPSQELVAKDLHGLEWRFRHVLRGKPARHLLTSGWSNFVTCKRLVAGDKLVVLRGENGELRVGVTRQRSYMSSSWIINNSQSMQLGVPTTEDVSSQTPFVVYYMPWTNQFILNLNNCLDAVKKIVAAGVRFSIRFQVEDSPGRRLSGIIVGVEDFLDRADSKWISLRVKWDEAASVRA